MARLVRETLMAAKNFRCRYCGHEVNVYKPYHSDEEGFWHFGKCPTAVEAFVAFMIKVLR